jgi:hippurate hydrolase
MIPLRLLLFPLLSTLAYAQNPSLKEIDSVYPDAHAMYVDLHQHPELSGHETETAGKLAKKLRVAGYEVTEHVGGTGVVALLKNGSGPVIMLRTELDALPVEENTGLPYASRVRTKDDAGREVGVMHACGHDVHMASLVGTAEVMARTKTNWHGTLILIGQPAEETIGGAEGMLRDGLFTRFPKPDSIVALHVGNELPAGAVSITPGIYNTNSDSVRITIYGKGGHGASPHTTVDPIVIAARTILALQTIASREVKPGELAIVTVGYIRAGTKNNIIPDQAEMGLTVRTYKQDVRKQVLAAISRIAKAEAEAAGAAREPAVEHYEGTDAVYNEPVLAERLRGRPLGGSARQGPRLDCSTDYAIRRFLVLCGAGSAGILFQPGRRRPAKVCGSRGQGHAFAFQPLGLVRPGRGSGAAHWHYRGSGSVAVSAEHTAERTTQAWLRASIQ